MYKIFLFLMLLPVLIFSQDFVDGWQLLPSAKDTIRALSSGSIQDSIAFPVDTTALKLLNMDEGRVAYLKQLSSANTNGGGAFIVMDSTLNESKRGAVFPHIVPGFQWIRLIYRDFNIANVLWYGADPDSGNDATSAFIAAQSTPKDPIIFAPGGGYKLSSGYGNGKFHLNGARVLRGQNQTRNLNRRYTKLYPNADRDTVLSVSRQGASYNNVSGGAAEITNINIYGIAGTDSASVGLLNASGDTKISHMDISYITNSDTGFGLYSPNGNSCIYTNVNIHACDVDAYLEATDNMTFNSCRFRYGKIYGVWLVDTESTSFYSCTVEAQWAHPDSADRSLKDPFASTTYKGMYFQHASRTGLYSMYTETGLDSNDVSLEIAEWSGYQSPYSQTDVEIYNGRITGVYGNTQIKVSTSHRAILNIYGGVITRRDGADYPPIDAPANVNYRINLYHTVVGGVSMPAGGIPYTITDYDSDKWAVASTWQTSANSSLYGWMDIYDGVGSGIRGVRTSGISTNTAGLYNGVDLHNEIWSGLLTAGYETILGRDTLNLDLVFFTTGGAWAGKDYSGRLMFANPNGNYGEMYDIEYFHGKDGSIINDFNYTQKYSHLSGVVSIDTMYVDSVSTSFARIIIATDSTTSYGYMSGKTILGSKVQSATLDTMGTTY